MKLGFMQVYNEVNWVGYAIDQAMMLCDKLLVVEGSQFTSFPDIPERSNDRTLDILSDKSRQYSSRIIWDKTTRRHKNYRHNQCENFNRALDRCCTGDYLLILDADDFFSDEWIEQANAIMEEGIVDLICVNSRDFSFGFNWVLDFDKSSPRQIAVKKAEGLHFVPTHEIKGAGDCIHLSDGIIRYHYTWVKPLARMLIRMQTSGMYPEMVKWLKKTWFKMKLEDGKVFQSFNGNFTLRRYEGTHPSILDNHPWRNVEDIRELGI